MRHLCAGLALALLVCGAHAEELVVSNYAVSANGMPFGVAMAKELAPVMMAVLIAGRIGSAMAAEIGSMRVYQEIDALRDELAQSR